MKTLLHCN